MRKSSRPESRRPSLFSVRTPEVGDGAPVENARPIPSRVAQIITFHSSNEEKQEEDEPKYDIEISVHAMAGTQGPKIIILPAWISDHQMSHLHVPLSDHHAPSQVTRAQPADAAWSHRRPHTTRKRRVQPADTVQSLQASTHNSQGPHSPQVPRAAHRRPRITADYLRNPRVDAA
ncbi:SNF2 domain-containing protein [Striga asiatica]|uniref:SNF2 domain-containing protein n=1 Tax=Striga asiatica TaxID=4170 RepID=A0A5A7P740_STRAF|nr:SNF2 domain-containing protein [Striga asiatica]